MTDQHDHYDDFEHHEGVTCPRCMGMATIDCHCGGDLCVCENYGERDCPLCLGEGSISEERFKKWKDRQREIADAVFGKEEGSS
jgi:hypothetical protein